jgi:hypothetical protein
VRRYETCFGGIVEVRELLEILNSARDLLADRFSWSPVHIATDKNGRWVPVGNRSAARFNLQGAVIRAAGSRARDAMKAAESVLRTCSSEAFASTLTSPRRMTHAEARAWLEAAISALTAQMGREMPARSPTGVSGTMLKASEADAIARQTTGTGGDEDE